MEVTVSNVIEIVDPSEELREWCEKELVIPNPDYIKKKRMGFWTGNTPNTIYLYETKFKQLVLPFGVLRKIPYNLLGDTIVESGFKCPVKVDYGGCAVPLYDYQKDALRAAYNARYGIIQSAAGSGKTQIGIALIKAYKKRALWLTHTLDLLHQSKARAEHFIDADMIGTITEGKVNIGAGVTFATVQTMSRLDLSKYKDYWDVIIVDECHRVAGSPTAVTQFYKVLNALSARHKYGLSATVHRADGMIKATCALIGEVVYEVPEEAIADKVMKVCINPVFTGIGLSEECLNTDGTLNYAKMISYLCGNERRNALIAGFIKSNKDRSALILSDRLSHLSALYDCLPPDMQKDAVMISGKMTSKKGKAEREKAIEDMRNGTKKYLFATYSLAKEGLDIPRLDRLFLATPQKDSAVITQSIGRIARTFDGKENPIAYDFVDATRYLLGAYKTRCRTYRKLGCFQLGGEE